MEQGNIATRIAIRVRLGVASIDSSTHRILILWLLPIGGLSKKRELPFFGLMQPN
jgi:hypothetical protein